LANKKASGRCKKIAPKAYDCGFIFTGCR